MATIEQLLADNPELGGLWDPQNGTYKAEVVKLGTKARAAWSPTHLLFEINGEAGALRVDQAPFQPRPGQ